MLHRKRPDRLDGGALSPYTRMRSLLINFYKNTSDGSASNVSSMDNIWEPQDQGECEKYTFFPLGLFFF